MQLIQTGRWKECKPFSNVESFNWDSYFFIILWKWPNIIKYSMDSQKSFLYSIRNLQNSWLIIMYGQRNSTNSRRNVETITEGRHCFNLILLFHLLQMCNIWNIQVCTQFIIILMLLTLSNVLEINFTSLHWLVIAKLLEVQKIFSFSISIMSWSITIFTATLVL